MNNAQILDGIIKYYETFNKAFPKKYNRTNPYNVQEYLLNLIDKKFNDDCSLNNILIENNLEQIFKFLGYNNIIVRYKKIERLDWENEWEKIEYIHSFKSYDTGAPTELSFVSYYGWHADPIDIIQFIFFTILLYENDFTWETYHKN